MQKGSVSATHWYTTITVVQNIHSGAQYIHDAETFMLPECQVASTICMISVLILSSTLTSQVVIRDVEKHYVKTEQTLSTLRPRN